MRSRRHRWTSGARSSERFRWDVIVINKHEVPPSLPLHPHIFHITPTMPHFPEAPPEATTLGSRSLPATNEQETAERQPPSPRPRPPPNDPQRTLRLRTQTRRRRYLALNPSYFDGANLEPKGY